MALDLLLTILLVLLNGFFVAAEFAIVKVRASQIELRAQTGNAMAKMAQNMLTHLDAYLSATQLGITLASLGLGWIGESVVSRLVINVMETFGYNGGEALAHSIALPISFAIITVLHIVFGELAPKSLAIQRSEATALAVALPLRFFYIVFSPFIWILNGLANAIVRMMGIQPIHGSEAHSPEELRMLFEQSVESGAMLNSQHELIENVFLFNERMVKQILVPRTRMIAVDVNSTEDNLMDLIFNEGYSRMPVYDGSIDNIVGILYVKDILRLMRLGSPIVIKDMVHPAYFVPETKKINLLLKQFQRRHMHMAVATDEFGGVSGIVTIEDIIEELVGEIQDEYDEEAPIVEKAGNNSYKVNGSAAISDANDFLPYPLPEGEDYETVGGMVNVLYGQIPEDISEAAQFHQYEIKVIERSERKVEWVLLTVRQPATDEDES